MAWPSGLAGRQVPIAGFAGRRQAGFQARQAGQQDLNYFPLNTRPRIIRPKFVIFADSIASLLLTGIRAAISAVFWRCCQMAKLARPIAKTDKAKAANVIKEPALDEGPLGGGAVWLCFDALACGGAV